MQASDVLADKALANVARWFRTILSHPHVAEYSGPITTAPASPSSSSTPAPHAATNGISHGQAARGGEASTSQSTSPPSPQSAVHADGQQQGQERPKGQDANGQQQGQAKPKGKDAKGGKLAKNDVAKGQKKGGDKKEKPSQAPKGNSKPLSVHIACQTPPPPSPLSIAETCLFIPRIDCLALNPIYHPHLPVCACGLLPPLSSPPSDIPSDRDIPEAHRLCQCLTALES